MRNLHELDRFRRCDRGVIELYGSVGGSEEGVFDVPNLHTRTCLMVVASTGLGWDHVSVSLANRCPNWEEMERVKRLFFEDDETAMQLHVPPSDHRCLHPYTLHLWRPNDGPEIPRPPNELVGTGEREP